MDAAAAEAATAAAAAAAAAEAEKAKAEAARGLATGTAAAEWAAAALAAAEAEASIDTEAVDNADAAALETAAQDFGAAAGAAAIPAVRRRVKAVLRAQEPGALRRLERDDPIVRAVLVALIELNNLPVREKWRAEEDFRMDGEKRDRASPTHFLYRLTFTVRHPRPSHRLPAPAQAGGLASRQGRGGGGAAGAGGGEAGKGREEGRGVRKRSVVLESTDESTERGTGLDSR